MPYQKHFYFLISFVLCLSCSRPEHENINPVTCPIYSTTPGLGFSDITLTLKLTNIIDTPTLDVPEFKYNKYAVFNLEWDDNTRNALEGFDLIRGFSYSDGSGNGIRIPFSAAVGVNGYTFDGDEIGCLADDIGYEEYDQLIRSGWDIMNHSNRHLDTGNVNVGSHLEDLTDLENLYYRKTAYRINCLIVPDNYIGFVPAAEQLGYLGSSSTVHHPYRLKHPQHSQIGNTSTFDDDFLQLNRDFKDDWDAQKIDDVLQKFSEMVSGSNNSTYLFYRLGTHNIEGKDLMELLTQLQNLSMDRVWFTTMREWLEYRYLREHVQINSTITGDQMEVVINSSALPAEFRWADLTLNLSGARIDSVSSLGADSVVFSNDMINVYRQIPYR